MARDSCLGDTCRELARTYRLGPAGAGPDQSLRHAGLGTGPFQLRPDNALVFICRDHARLVRSYGLAGEHYPALPATERDGGAGDPDAEGTMCEPTSLREPDA